MPAVAMGLLFLGYGTMFWGWTLVKGYNISVTEIFVPGKYRGTWPPPAAGAPAASGAGGSGATGPTPTPTPGPSPIPRPSSGSGSGGAIGV